MRWRWTTGPTFLAAVVTLANAAKPVLVDDTAYLAFARHIAYHPLDPYGFQIFWYSEPEPAMGVLCPPVVPYWLAAGIHVVGDHPAALKLWLFPFVWLFAWALRDLLRRFARGTERAVLPLVVLSPAVLPMVNVMLDVPAVALGLVALVLFVKADRRGSWCLAVAAGAVAALAIQTKYTALLVPAVIGWYGLTHRRVGYAVVAVGVCVILFAGWEALLHLKYGESHFLHHLRDQQPDAERSFLKEKAALLPPLAGHLGCLAVGIGLYAGRAVGVPRWALLGFTLAWMVGVALVAVLPYHATILIPGKEPGTAKLAVASTVWRTAGTTVLLTAAGCAAVLLFRPRRGRSVRWSRDSWFVVGWVLLELAGYFALTPFPAARRVVGVTVALGVLAARAVSRMNRVKPDRRPPAWVVPFGLAVGVLVAALDAYDARPEKVLAERAAAYIRGQAPDAPVWFVGHWGFQFYCEREGMQPVVPGRTRLEAGDYLVLPLFPDDRDFYRPDSVHSRLDLPADTVTDVAEFVWEDNLSAQTIPNFYGGIEPVLGRDHPRLRIGVFRVVRPWVAQRR